MHWVGCKRTGRFDERNDGTTQISIVGESRPLIAQCVGGTTATPSTHQFVGQIVRGWVLLLLLLPLPAVRC